MALDLPFDRPGVRRLHQSRSATGDDVDSHVRQLEAELLHLVVGGIAAADARTAEDRDAVVLDTLRLDLVEIVDRLPELVDRLVEDVGRIGRGPLLGRSLRSAQLFQLGSGRLAARVELGRGRFGIAVTRIGHGPGPPKLKAGRNHNARYFVIQTSLENVLNFASAALASSSERNFTRTR
jgi:hypothetical protein